jgi:hypothetical protein
LGIFVILSNELPLQGTLSVGQPSASLRHTRSLSFTTTLVPSQRPQSAHSSHKDVPPFPLIPLIKV